MKSTHIIGIMSGTSLDGLDIADCIFTEKDGKLRYQIKCAETIPYSKFWKRKLETAPKLSGEGLMALHFEYGRFIGNSVTAFMERNLSRKVDFISSHGHTVFHQPHKGFTFQLGNGASISSVAGLPVVSDFRNADVAKGGQGAPLVPVGDMLLFSEFSACLNLGGFANISYSPPSPQRGFKRVALDICPVNITLNYLAEKKGMNYDRNGTLAASGSMNKKLLDTLNRLPFYKTVPPKSLSREWFEKKFKPILDGSSCSVEDKLSSVAEHIKIQILNVQQRAGIEGKALVTGGGAHNKHLVRLLHEINPSLQWIIPDKKLIDYKEALIFAFLGLLRWKGEINCLKSITGASSDSCSGCINLP